MAYLTVNGVELFYEDEGAGRPVVFLHGWGTSGRVWGGQLPDLVQDHRVITVDWRGCGRSARPAAGNTIATITRDILELVSALALPAPVLVGSSLAGASEIPRQVPEQCAALIPGAEVILVEGAGHISQQDQPARFNRALRTALSHLVSA